MTVDYSKLKQGLSGCLTSFHLPDCEQCPYLQDNNSSETVKACRYQLYIDFSKVANDAEGSALLNKLKHCILNKQCEECAYLREGRYCTTFLYKELAFYLRKGIFENDEKKN